MKQFFVAVLLVTLGFFIGKNSTDISAPVIMPEITGTVANIIATQPEPPTETYLVTKVVDGDTLSVTKEGVTTTLRLIGIDTPETVDPRKPVQCFGKEASARAKELLAGKTVRLEFDASQGEKDKYGRTLAYVYLPDGALFNQRMIEEGFAHEYTYNTPYRFQAEFKLAEKTAREEKRGLWGDTCTTTQAKPTVAKITTSPANNGSHICTTNTYNCTSFTTQAEAQNAFDTCGGTTNDVHKLDRDGDGRVCEGLE